MNTGDEIEDWEENAGINTRMVMGTRTALEGGELLRIGKKLREKRELRKQGLRG